jgi:hypothetical protein
MTDLLTRLQTTNAPLIDRLRGIQTAHPGYDMPSEHQDVKQLALLGHPATEVVSAIQHPDFSGNKEVAMEAVKKFFGDPAMNKSLSPKAERGFQMNQDNMRDAQDLETIRQTRVIQELRKAVKDNDEFIKKNGIDEFLKSREELIKSGKGSILPSMKKK